MGAAYVEAWLRPIPQKQVKEWFRLKVAQAAREHGSLYSGSWGEKAADGLKFGPVFEDYDEAVEYVERKAEKWGPALAVQYIKGEQLHWYVGAWCSC